jgi:hypothetical protein
MSALLVIWFGMPLLAFLAPYAARAASAMVALWEAASEAYRASNARPMVWRAYAARRFDALLTAYRWAVEPNMMIRMRFYELDPYIWEE